MRKRKRVSKKSSKITSLGSTLTAGRPRYNFDLPKEIEITGEFRAALDSMENTNDCIFIAGKAGTGKSTLLQYFRENTQKRVIVLAPTGVAAINVAGQTIHSFFRFPPKLIRKDNIYRRRDRALFDKVNAIIIDEVSMVRVDVMEGIDYALRVNRERMEEPFGGLQMIMFGDLFQLPPVVEPEVVEYLSEKYDSPYFFSARVFQDIFLKRFELTKIFRQTDQEFIELLGHIRHGERNQEDLKTLNSRVNKRALDDSSHCITLTSRNANAARINENRLRKLLTGEYRYVANIEGEFEEKSYPAESTLRLKVGAQVMLIRNDPEKRWVNGTICEIGELSDHSVSVVIDGAVYEVPRAIWNRIVYEYNGETDTIEEKVIGSFEQYPIRLAWAITIHKSQGQTFDKVIVDFGDGAFTHGQAYVAMSRCTNLDGISLRTPIIPSDIIFDPRIIEFSQGH